MDGDETPPPGGVWQAVSRQAADTAALAQSQAFLRSGSEGRGAEDSGIVAKRILKIAWRNAETGGAGKQMKQVLHCLGYVHGVRLLISRRF